MLKAVRPVAVVAIFAGLFIAATACSKKPAPAKAPPQAAAPQDPVRHWQEVIKTAPSYENYVNLGLELGKQKRSAEAIGAYQKAGEINPKSPLAWNNICSELNSQQSYAEAITYCEKALAVEPNFQLAKNNLAFGKAKLTEAKATVEKRKAEVLAQKKQDSKDLLELGMDLYRVQDYSAANQIWKLIKKGDTFYAMAKNNEASANIMMDKLPAAERALQEALALDANNPLFLNNKKWLEQKKAEKK